MLRRRSTRGPWREWRERRKVRDVGRDTNPVGPGDLQGIRTISETVES